MPTRARLDACPSVFAPHDAADGALARIRLPGGVIDASACRVVAGCADDLGDGQVHLTSRGNLQLRGLDRGNMELVGRLADGGLLPSAEHERVRNVLASPLSGVSGGRADVRALAPTLDRTLCAQPGMAALPGRFLFALDDGRGDVAAEHPDLCWQAVGQRCGALLVAGTDSGVRVDITDAVDALLAAAQAFLDLRATDGTAAWRAYELSDGAARIAAALGSAGRSTRSDRPPAAGGRTAEPPALPRANARTAVLSVPPSPPPAPPPAPDVRIAGPPGPPRPGQVLRDDGGIAFVAAAVLGVLDAAALRLLADIAPCAVVTPWRTILLPDPAGPAGLTARRLRDGGLVVDPDSPAPQISACTGRPGCAKALADVRSDALAALAAGRVPAGRRIHVAGCERRCGAPRAPHIDVLAVGTGGYLVDGVHRCEVRP